MLMIGLTLEWNHTLMFEWKLNFFAPKKLKFIKMKQGNAIIWETLKG
jgi:hypothetical protein